MNKQDNRMNRRDFLKIVGNQHRRYRRSPDGMLPPKNQPRHLHKALCQRAR